MVFNFTLILAVPRNWTDLFVRLHSFENIVLKNWKFFCLLWVTLPGPSRGMLVYCCRPGGISGVFKELPVFIQHYCPGWYLRRVPDGRVIWGLCGYRMGVKSCAPEQLSLTLSWTPKSPTAVQPGSCVAAVTGTGQEGPKTGKKNIPCFWIVFYN